MASAVAAVVKSRNCALKTSPPAITDKEHRHSGSHKWGSLNFAVWGVSSGRMA
jgi:hypothetical protein